MPAAGVPGEFDLVYLVCNGIMNVTTQEEQIAVFRKASKHLVNDGRFVVEVIVPQLSKVPAEEVARVSCVRVVGDR
jgi:hypothetical protein